MLISIRKVDELEKAISLAITDSSKYGIDQPELEKRFKLTRTSRTQVVNVRKLVMGIDLNGRNSCTYNRMHQPSLGQQYKSNHYIAKDHDDFISSESDTQMMDIASYVQVFVYKAKQYKS
uniref:Uncharacterized protein n=1 Tax=Lactuca sativa TaxID=4236 RepID=A0A9R1VPU6_LACSA|nr:hypothetical protein LSAT_V11C500291270 [Lactuca sativa]